MSQELKIYEVTNRVTGERRVVAAKSAQEACEQEGWLIGDCYVQEQTPRFEKLDNGSRAFLVKVPCKVCPYQYAECVSPAEIECPCRPNIPDFNRWLSEASKAHLCDYVGVPLKREDYNLLQKWTTIDEAIKILTEIS